MQELFLKDSLEKRKMIQAGNLDIEKENGIGPYEVPGLMEGRLKCKKNSRQTSLMVE